jgi:hypothetical protein
VSKVLFIDREAEGWFYMCCSMIVEQAESIRAPYHSLVPQSNKAIARVQSAVHRMNYGNVTDDIPETSCRIIRKRS